MQLTVNHNVVVPNPRQATADLVQLKYFSLTDLVVYLGRFQLPA